jgi:hypothetical protein
MMTRLYLIGFLATAALCLAAQSTALRKSGGSTVKSESNYFSSIARLQSHPSTPPKAMLLGSSLTGRLADRGTLHPSIANLGCDGGTAVITLRAIDQGLITPAPTLVIEANTLSYELEGRGREIANAIRTPWFSVGKSIPNLSATARPTAFAYSWLMAKRGEGPTTTPPNPLLQFPNSPNIPTTLPFPSITPQADKLTTELSAILSRLQKRDITLILVMLPPGREPSSIDLQIAAQLSAKNSIPFWDMSQNLPPNSLGYTDGIHLDTPGARQVSAAITRRILPP